MSAFHRTRNVTQRARALRRSDNAAEGALWNVLKAKQLGGYKFVRQMPIGPYFAGFVARSAKLVVEVDGSQHAGSIRDQSRDDYMRRKGYSVLRVWSHDVIRNRAAVCDTILAALEGRLAQDVIAFDMKFVACRPSPA
jgi:very-short-patch-repair endonuclease